MRLVACVCLYLFVDSFFLLWAYTIRTIISFLGFASFLFSSLLSSLLLSSYPIAVALTAQQSRVAAENSIQTGDYLLRCRENPYQRYIDEGQLSRGKDLIIIDISISYSSLLLLLSISMLNANARDAAVSLLCCTSLRWNPLGA